MELNTHNLIDDAKCCDAVRNLRWPNEVKRLHCQSNHIVKRGKDDAYYMPNILRIGIIENKSEPELTGEIECDEVYVVAGHKGKPESVKKRKRT